MMSEMKNYDVVILTHAPKDIFVKSLEMLLSQSVRPEKIIVYNTDKSLFYKNVTDKNKLKNLLEENENIIEVVDIEEKDFDHGRARNDAEKICTSKYVLYMTDDALPYDETLGEKLMMAFDKYSDGDGKVAVSFARQIAKPDAKYKEKYVREFNYPEYDIIKEKSKEGTLGIKNYFCSNVCAMYDREIFEKNGRFEENIILNEDTFYVYKAINDGYKIVYFSDAKVYHSHNYNYREQFERNFDIGVSQCEKKAIFSKIPSSREGMRMIFNVSIKLIKKLHFISLIDFMVECIYRYLGFKKGMSFDSLSIDECIKCASNKNYFIKKKESYDN